MIVFVKISKYNTRIFCDFNEDNLTVTKKVFSLQYCSILIMNDIHRRGLHNLDTYIFHIIGNCETKTRPHIQTNSHTRTQLYSDCVIVTSHIKVSKGKLSRASKWHHPHFAYVLRLKSQQRVREGEIAGSLKHQFHRIIVMWLF